MESNKEKEIAIESEETLEEITSEEQEQVIEVEGQEKKKGGIWSKGKKSKWEKKYKGLKEDCDELKDKHLRLHAEFDNFRKRSLREKIDYMKTASAETIRAILPILDDFDRAKQSSENEETEEKMTEGMELLYTKMYRILAEKGLQPMVTDEETFNPDLHEAITKAPAPTEEMKGKVLHTVEKGYILNDKIIRHAKVVVAS